MKWIAVFIFIATLEARAGLSFPSSLTARDRGQVLAILGYGSAVKIDGNPYPLGGHSGLEIGLSTDFINTSQIAKLGNGSTQQAQTSYNVLSFGKGLYNNLDVFLQAAYLGQSESVTNFGGQIRWGFYESRDYPIFATLIVHGDSTNFSNLVITSTFGVDTVLGLTEGNATFYLGAGIVRAMGTFAGGTGGVTSNGQTEQNGIQDNRVLLGLNFRIAGQFFVAGEVESYAQPSYAAKVGMRF